MLRSFALAALQALPPETAHRLALRALAAGLGPRAATPPDPRLAVDLWGLSFPNPIGVAAGFDKNAEAPDALAAMGAGFVEIGAVTPRPQAGNPKPRLFRLAEDRAAINRMGFNNEGLARIAERLARRKSDSKTIVGANLGANKDSPDRRADYEQVLEGLWGLCAFYTVNVSSPNTERLRDLQGRDALTELLARMVFARDRLAAGSAGAKPPLLVKIAPDLSDAELADVAAVACETGLDGIVATNTTLARPASLKSPHASEKGGLSGAPLKARSTEVVRALARLTEGRIPIIGVGGIETAEDAYEKIRAGAALVQLYTALAYRGPELMPELTEGLSRLLDRDGFDTVAQAVGADL
ncbi:MAG: quinone-dependent dihydroorotate dehydrogenase [Pseudomonadota bacterium]